MISCICIDDTQRPYEVPKEKWPKEGNEYHVIYTVVVLPQKQLAFHIAEIDLDESCKPYEYFLAKRFIFTEENILKLIELIKDCNDTSFSLEELMEQTQLETA